MLKSDKTCPIKEIKNFKSFITVIYTIINDIYQKVTPAHTVKQDNKNVTTFYGKLSCNRAEAMIPDSLENISGIMNIWFISLSLHILIQQKV